MTGSVGGVGLHSMWPEQGPEDPDAGKPAEPSTRTVRADLNKLKKLIGEVQRQDGKVNVGKLAKEVRGTRDPDVLNAFEAMKDQYTRTSTRTETYATGCGGSGTRTRTVEADPEYLDPGEVATVLEDLAAARAEAKELDVDGDGRLSEGEIAGADDLEGAPGQFVRASVQEYMNELSCWTDARLQATLSVDERLDVDDQIGSAVAHHAKSAAGRKALTAAYRDLLTRPDGLVDEGEDVGDFLRNLPLFFGFGASKLSNEEVGKYLGTDDLAAFTKDRYEVIEARVGGDYEDFYLKGLDLPESERPSSGSSSGGSSYTAGCS